MPSYMKFIAFIKSGSTTTGQKSAARTLRYLFQKVKEMRKKHVL